ncbi:MAG: hypothetical protein Q8927_02020 [Bacteroidota bacterium]|nr:hypothetical protein [Bacteroidota bacterium]MDP4214948.1 hypothetical protein [Bacteroidota bacterium]MDP4244627.1 hypothetical protein [Bacteroidota bacterium]MDP4255937.1 hypothetical protein [Bacteroidota bacterium]MDP4258677.1 hypothetical protein [Bacteroidota bacterium]
MSKILANTKHVFSLLTLAGLLMAGTLHAEGGNGNAKKTHEHKSGSANTAELLYVGKLAGQPVFNVVYNNPSGSRFSISVLDGRGEQLFIASYNDKFFDKKFTPSEDLDTNGKLVFVVRNFSDNSVQHFEINTGSRLVEDIVVKEVK